MGSCRFRCVREVLESRTLYTDRAHAPLECGDDTPRRRPERICAICHLRRCSNQYADVVSERNIRLSQAKARDSTRSAPSPVRVFSQVRVELQQRISPVACAGGAGGWGVMVTMREDAMAVAVARAAPVFALRSSCSAVSGTCHGLGY